MQAKKPKILIVRIENAGVKDIAKELKILDNIGLIIKKEEK